MRRSAGLGLLMTLACPLVLAGQGAAGGLARQGCKRRLRGEHGRDQLRVDVGCGFLVMFMQAGFAMVETGSRVPRTRRTRSTMNFMVYGIAMLAYLGDSFRPPGGWRGGTRYARRIRQAGARSLHHDRW